MPQVPNFFEFTSYEFKPAQRRVFFNYRLEFSDGTDLKFKETIVLPKIPRLEKIPSDLIGRILTDVHIVLGMSYYKMYCPSSLHIKAFPKAAGEFWSEVYKKGLGEFWYRNNLDPARSPKFSIDEQAKNVSWKLPRKNRALIGIGGGKDSIVAAELLRGMKYDITSFVVETQRESKVVNDVLRQVGAPVLKIRRILDEKLFAALPGTYEGHIPVSAIYAFLGIFAAVCYDYTYVVVGNARSSDFGNVIYQGQSINHQWSKTEEFEVLLQNYTRLFLTPDITYFSPLRAFYEIRIARIFTQYEQYFPYFSSCNRNFKVYQNEKPKRWCGKCPKCAYVYLLLSAFLPKKKILSIFEQDLFANKELLPLYQDILGFGTMKPFDCVGRFEESQAALYLVSRRNPQVPVVKKFFNQIKNPEALGEMVMKTNDAPFTPARFRFLGMKNILILGYGKEGRATRTYLKQRSLPAKIGIADKRRGTDYPEYLKKFDIAVKTPSKPGRLVAIPYTTATDIFFSEVRNMIVGVTGSKGKSTTASLIYAILKEADKSARLLGNIGIPMLGALNQIHKNEILVIELSSYQLEDIHVSPHIAVVTNLFPEHMDYHGSEEAYYAAKKNITKFQTSQDFFVYNPRDPLLKIWASEGAAKSIPFASDITIALEKTQLIGEHNKINIQAATAVARLLDISDSVILRAVKRFKPLPHRLEFVGTFKGILFYDDAISTTPESTIAALKALPQVETILLGGQDRGYNFAALEKELRIQGVKNLVLFPDSGSKILSSRKGFSSIFETADMKKAVEFCYSHTAPGSICLLSTASPSYSIWKNFEEKGNEFKKWVKKLGNTI